MQKPVKAVIASARVLMRRPSEARLPTDDMKLILHQVLEELHGVCLKENSDYFTHDGSIVLTYDDTLLGYTFSIPGLTSLQGWIPVFLKYQGSTSDPNKDPWYRVPVQRYASFGGDVAPGRVEAAFIGNTWQGINPAHFKINLSSEDIANRTWRAAYRIFPTDVLSLDDDTPFLPEFTTLVETMLALRSIPLVLDDSASWRSFIASQTQMLLTQEMSGKASLKEWVGKDVDNHFLTPAPYNYRTNNPQMGPAVRRYRVDPTG